MARVARVMITGASGFVGRYVADALRSVLPGIELIMATRAQTDGGAHILNLDVTAAEAVAEAVRFAQPDALIHLAAVSSVKAAFSNQRNTWQVNTMGTLNVLDGIIKHAPRCHFVYASSGEVYGSSAFDGMPITEDRLLAPQNPYAASKAAADLMAQEAALRGVQTTIVRPFNHTGPGQTDAFAIPSFCRQIVEIERALRPPVLMVGELNDERDFLSVIDVARAYALIVMSRESLPNGTVLNIASGQPRRIGDLLNALLSETDRQIKIEIDPSRLRPTRVPRIVGDAARARELLGWCAQTPLEQTLKDTLQHWRRTLGGAGNNRERLEDL